MAQTGALFVEGASNVLCALPAVGGCDGILASCQAYSAFLADIVRSINAAGETVVAVNLHTRSLWSLF